MISVKTVKCSYRVQWRFQCLYQSLVALTIETVMFLFMKFQGKRCASGKGMKVIVKVAGGEAVESKGCVTDGKLVTAASASDLPAFLSDLSTALGVSVMF